MKKITKKQYQQYLSKGYCNYKEGTIHFEDSEFECSMCIRKICSWHAIELLNGNYVCPNCEKYCEINEELE